MSVSRRTILGGLVALPVAAVTGASIAPGDANAAVILNPANFTLVRGSNNTTISALDAVLPNVSVDTVLNSANRTATPRPANPAPYAAGFLWQSDDGGSTEWFPQGITTSADYHDDGLYNGRKVILASWYDKGDRGVRVSFVDMTNPNQPVYRHVLLVEPYGGSAAPNFRALTGIHAGGIFWYGDATNNYLYIVDTHKGLRVFDLNHIWEVTTNNDEGPIGKQANGTYMAHNYRYVVPQKFAYNAITIVPSLPVRFSFVSLDRTSTPDSIIVGEYNELGDGTRLFRWGIDATTRELRHTGGIATATWAAQVDIISMQGATSIGNKFYISRSKGENTGGDMLTWVPGNNATIHSILPPGPEDVSYDHNTGRLWSLSEWPGSRQVYALNAAQIG